MFLDRANLRCIGEAFNYRRTELLFPGRLRLLPDCIAVFPDFVWVLRRHFLFGDDAYCGRSFGRIAFHGSSCIDHSIALRLCFSFDISFFQPILDFNLCDISYPYLVKMQAAWKSAKIFELDMYPEEAGIVASGRLKCTLVDDERGTNNARWKRHSHDLLNVFNRRNANWYPHSKSYQHHLTNASTQPSSY